MVLAPFLFGAFRSFGFRRRFLTNSRAGNGDLVTDVRREIDTARRPDDFYGLRSRAFDTRQLESVRFIALL